MIFYNLIHYLYHDRSGRQRQLEEARLNHEREMANQDHIQVLL